jgi:tetratricopeptide (TPR) repeat protein
MRSNPLLTVVALAAVVISTGCVLNPNYSPQQRARGHLDNAQNYQDGGLLDSALAEFGLALEVNPNIADAHIGMGGIYQERGDYEMASRAYERATIVEPDNFKAHYNLGLMKQLLGRLREALRAYKTAWRLDPDDFQVNRGLGSTYLQLNRPGEALTFVQIATRLDPDSQAAWCNLAATYNLLGRYEDAVDTYRQAAELGNLADPVLLGLADAHIHLNNFQQALNVLEALIRRSPSVTAYERLGYVRFKMRQFKQALFEYRQAMALNPNDTATLNGLGACLMTLYIQDGRTDTPRRDEALNAWRKSVRINHQQPRIIDLIARFSRI